MSKQEQGDNLSDDGDKEDDEEYPPWLQHIVEGEYYNAVRVVEEEGRLLLLQLLSVRLCCGSTGSGPNKHLSVSVCSFVLHHTLYLLHVVVSSLRQHALSTQLHLLLSRHCLVCRGRQSAGVCEMQGDYRLEEAPFLIHANGS